MTSSDRRFAALVPAFALLLVGCGGESPSDDGSPDDSSTAAFTLDEGTLTLNPGQEGLFCRQMPVPAKYTETEYFVTGVDADVSLGTHHLVVTASDTDVQQEPPLCKDTGSGQTGGGANFQDFAVDPNPSAVIETLKRIAFGGGGGEAKVRFPKGYGKPMPKGFFESSHHVINTGGDPLGVHGLFHVHAAPADEIDFPMGVLFANALQVDVPPNSDGSVEATMTVPEPVDLVVLTSHAHNYLTRFEMFAYRGGAPSAEPIYVNEDWESPAVSVLDPPLRLEAGDGVMFRCSYRNDTAAKLGWGITNGEMCMPFVMYSYPEGTTRGVPPTMSVAMSSTAPVVLQPGNGGFGG
jgi:hypothetical protein